MGNLLKGLTKVGVTLVTSKMNQNTKDAIEEIKNDINYALNKNKDK